MIHEDPDDLGLGGHDDSLKTGHAGKRITCAVILRLFLFMRRRLFIRLAATLGFALFWIQVGRTTYSMTGQKKYQVILYMSLSDQNIENLKKKLNDNTTLSIKSKTNLNAFINNRKNTIGRAEFMQLYNARTKNLRNGDKGTRKRSRNNLNSAMEINNGNVSGESVNPTKNGRMSPRGPLSGISGASNTSNNRNNVSSSPNKKKARFETAAVGAQRAIAAANNARRKAVANVKRKAIIDRQQGNANVKRKAAANKVNANARENAELLMNVSRKAAAEKANANAKAMANRAATNKAVANKLMRTLSCCER